MKLERSTDGGVTWHEVIASSLSLLTIVGMSDKYPYDDGCGNLYRPLEGSDDRKR